MEHISEILKRQTLTNSSKASMDTSSSAEASSEATCPVCKGFGFVNPRLPNNKPDYSRLVPCRCALKEDETKLLSRLQRYSNLGSLTRLTFATLALEGKHKDIRAQEQFRRACEAAVKFAEKPAGWLFFSGPSGTGKTHLAAAIANRCLENNLPAFYTTTPDLLDHLRASFSPGSEMPYDEFFEQVRNAAVLVLDDFGTQSSSAWAKEKLDQLLSHRYANRLPTVIVSIAPLEELEERVRTRLTNTEYCQVYDIGGNRQELHLHEWAPRFELQKHMTFESFNQRTNLPAEQKANLKFAYDLAKLFAESPDSWLIFMGSNGCGKTHLAAAIVNARYKQGKPAMFIVVPDFLDYLRSTFSPDSKVGYDKLFESVKNVELLVLDDFGEQASTPWAQEKLYQVINHRYNARLATVITTSCSLEELDTRIASRFSDHQICNPFNITAPDFRADHTSQKKVIRPPRKTG